MSENLSHHIFPFPEKMPQINGFKEKWFLMVASKLYGKLLTINFSVNSSDSCSLVMTETWRIQTCIITTTDLTTKQKRILNDHKLSLYT